MAGHIELMKAASMTSQEISELVGSRHDKVKQSIERLANRKGADGNPAPVIQLPPMGKVRNHIGQNVSEYIFTGDQGKRDCLVVVAQLSPEFTGRVVDRWQELEAQQTPTIPQTYAAALLEAGRLAQLVEDQSKQLALAAPKVEFVDQYVESTGLKGFRQVCKLLQANETTFRQFLVDKKIMYRLNGEWTATAQHIEAGRFATKTGVNQHNDHAYSSSLFTPKGVEWIAGEWGKYKLEMYGQTKSGAGL